ncbi:flagellar protein FliT [Gallaecimonas kandeliae]|uniref:flagellar protein FliT n=1 Tax=Gallaecimonas kandeliae TaxID=3029055 RepID=UPI002649E794|nr:flagellar protein FliT [Gallaecimonas kandeliae]WKE66722.1 flagellar protein FliT [Gallaecimonas kandeliae]
MAAFDALHSEICTLETLLSASFQGEQWQQHSELLAKRQSLLEQLHQAALTEDRVTDFRVLAERLLAADEAIEQALRQAKDAVEVQLQRQSRSSKAIKKYMKNLTQFR